MKQRARWRKIVVRRDGRMPVLPTLLTLGNAFCGFASITYAAKLGPDLVQPGDMHLRIAAFYIFLGMVFDALDGPVARMTRQQSEFGAHLDSLCDVITFGVAPAFLLRQFSASSFLHPRILWGIAAIYVVCAILRLARFNTDTGENDSHTWFVGLPSPAAAATIASFPIAMEAVQRWLNPSTVQLINFSRSISEWLNSVLSQILPIVALLVGVLMVSQIRYPHLVNQWISKRRNRFQIVRFMLIVVAAFVIGEFAILIAALWFAFAIPVTSAIQQRLSTQGTTETANARVPD